MNKKFSMALSLAVITAMLITSLALADQINADADALVLSAPNANSVTATQNSGTTVSYNFSAIVRNTGNATNDVFAASGDAVSVTIAKSGSWDGGGTSGPWTFNAYETPQAGTIQISVPCGSEGITQTMTVTLTGTASNGKSLSPDSRTLSYVITGGPDDSSCTPPDTTAPTAAPTLSGTAGTNGWYTSDVTVTWNWSDNAGGSGINSNNCPATSTSSGEGTLTVSADCYDLAGNKGTASVNVNVDKTAPAISFVGPSTAAWYNADVTASWSCSDATSGPVSASVSAVASGDGNAVAATGTCVDLAGLTASDTQYFMIDKTAPVVSLVGGPASGVSYYFGSVPSAPTCSASDALSGLAAPCSVSGYGTTVGSHTVTASASDIAGNSASASATYTVLAWTLNGFYNPVDMNGVYNTVRGGSTVPLKFEVFAGSTKLTATSVVASFVQTRINCDGTSPVDDIEFTTTGGTSLRYDATAGQFIQNWQTPRQANACYRVTLTTQDGSSLVAFFKLK